MARKRSRRLEHAALRRLWHKDGTYERFFERQNGVCGICAVVEIRRKLDIDHDHATMKPRGLLCRGCNIQLPRWPAWKLRAAADYLDRVEETE